MEQRGGDERKVNIVESHDFSVELFANGKQLVDEFRRYEQSRDVQRLDNRAADCVGQPTGDFFHVLAFVVDVHLAVVV